MLVKQPCFRLDCRDRYRLGDQSPFPPLNDIPVLLSVSPVSSKHVVGWAVTKDPCFGGGGVVLSLALDQKRRKQD